MTREAMEKTSTEKLQRWARLGFFRRGSKTESMLLDELCNRGCLPEDC